MTRALVALTLFSCSTHQFPLNDWPCRVDTDCIETYHCHLEDNVCTNNIDYQLVGEGDPGDPDLTDQQPDDDGPNLDPTDDFPDQEFPTYCGNGLCDPTEDCRSCEEDCGRCCGNGLCDDHETCRSCEKDCKKCCGNHLCEEKYGEDCLTCEKDCKKCCGDHICNFLEHEENCETCEKDCGVCPPICGDTNCDDTETCNNCPEDCGPCATGGNGGSEGTGGAGSGGVPSTGNEDLEEIEMVSPKNDELFSTGDTIELKVKIRDTTNIKAVRYWADKLLGNKKVVCLSQTPPFDCTWEGFDLGRYELWAKLKRTNDKTTTSKIVHVWVKW